MYTLGHPRVKLKLLLIKVFFKIGVVKNFGNHRKMPVLNSLFNKVEPLRPATLLKRDSNTGVWWWYAGGPLWGHSIRSKMTIKGSRSAK